MANIIGTNNNDVLFGEVEDDTIRGRGGNDLLIGGGGDDLLRGGRGDDLLFGGSGNDNLRGGAGDDFLSGGSGDDRLNGGAGSDFLFGGSGDDTFIFTDGSGQDVILDFDAGLPNDRIVLRNLGLTSLQDVLDNGSDSASGFVLQVGDNQLTLLGVSSSQLDADDFIFRNRATNLAPDALDDTGSISENGSLLIDASQGLLSNDTDPDADTLIINSINGSDANLGVPVQGTNGGLFTIAADGSYEFFTGTDFDDLAVGETRATTVQYAVTDGNGGSDTATLTVTVIGENDAPNVSTPLMISVTEDQPPLQIDLLQGASDVDSNETSTLNIANVSGLVDGLTLSESILTVDPSASSFQSLSLNQTQNIVVNYDVIDVNGSAVSQELDILISGVNDAPSLVPGALSAVEDGNVVLLDLANFGNDIDSDDDGTTLVYSITNTPLEGEASISGSILTFDVGNDFQDLMQGETREIQFEVTAIDRHGATGSSMFTVTVSGVDDAIGTRIVNIGRPGDIEFGGDFNGDGIDDLILGAPRNNSTSGGNQVQAGQSFVLFGREFAIGETVQGQPATIDEGIEIQGWSAFDFNGTSVALNGDFNGDGFADAVSGIPNGNTGFASQMGAGHSFVVYGGLDQFDPTDPTDNDVLAFGGVIGGSSPRPENTSIIYGDRSDAASGSALDFIGDINSNGFDDLLIGAPGRDAGDSGLAYVYFGGSNFPDLLRLDQLDGSNGVRFIAENAGDRLGTAVSRANDINGDGLGDFLISAPGFVSDTGETVGAVYAIFGSETLGNLGADISLSNLDSQDGFRITGNRDDTLFGITVETIGDVNGGGIDDIVITEALGPDPSGVGQSGAFHIIYGESIVAGNVPTNISELDGTNGYSVYSSTGLPRISTAGDFNSDGFEDYVFYERREIDSNPIRSDAFLVLGNGSAPNAVNQVSDVFEFFDVFTFSGTALNNFGGILEGGGDFNGDGVDDLIASYTVGNAIEAFVIFGGTDSLETLDALDNVMDNSVDVMLLA